MLKYICLKKKFGDKKVLDGISFEVQKKEIFFILGTSGTGKSVLLKNTVGLLKPDAGEIWIDGQNITLLNEDELFLIRKKCSMIFQQPALFDSLTIFENIAFGLRMHFNLPEEEIINRVKNTLNLVNLGDILNKYPQDISYGMQKRVSLARTLAIKPEILLFDEPTTGLDPITTNAINFLIKDLSRKLQTTSLVVSHDMHCALSIADKIIVLDKGRIVAFGNKEQIKENDHPLVKGFLKEAFKKGYESKV